MQEQAAGVYGALSEAIDTIEKDITYNPAEFLGFALYPDQIWSLVTFLGTTAFALYQSNFQ